MTKLSTRSTQFQDGYRKAAKEAVTWLHAHAGTMNDPSARAALNVAADDMGRRFKASSSLQEKEAMK